MIAREAELLPVMHKVTLETSFREDFQELYEEVCERLKGKLTVSDANEAQQSDPRRLLAGTTGGMVSPLEALR